MFLQKISAIVLKNFWVIIHIIQCENLSKNFLRFVWQNHRLFTSLKIFVQREGLFILISHHTRLLIFANALLEKVSFTLQ
jgi:hypothetical protein